ncbi:MAG: multicopper oxidase domain-containing protein, partial [Phycisphaerales bacterium]|nr:multicopper oxidase domain-containing protein [Phycisphaerales bacterium]
YGGTYPGPTIEARTGLPVTVRWINDLRDEGGTPRTDHYLEVDLCPHGPNHLGPTPRTVTHLHGGHVPAEYDGYPEFTDLPGEMSEYVYPNDQDAATLWYHDHALGITRLNVYLGLAGFYLVRDDVEDALGLPSGSYEIPLVIQDRTFNSDGSLFYPGPWQDHFFGDTILVNGKVWPYLDVDRGKYRFRVLNGSNSRTYTLALDDGATFYQIGSDGGLLEAPVPLTTLTLAPAERADLVIDFASYAPGTEIVLENSAPAPFPGDPGVGVVPNVMQFRVGAADGDQDPIPGALRPVEPIDEAEAVMSREFEMRRFSEPCAGSHWLINELRWDDIAEYPILGSTEIWSFVNRSSA